MILKFDDIKQKIVEELNKRVPNLKCPICSNGEMILADGFISHQLNKELTGNFILGGPTIPVVAVICKHCGHTMEFSVGALGLLTKEDDQNEKPETGGNGNE